MLSEKCNVKNSSELVYKYLQQEQRKTNDIVWTVHKGIRSRRTPILKHGEYVECAVSGCASEWLLFKFRSVILNDVVVDTSGGRGNIVSSSRISVMVMTSVDFSCFGFSNKYILEMFQLQLLNARINFINWKHSFFVGYRDRMCPRLLIMSRRSWKPGV